MSSVCCGDFAHKSWTLAQVRSLRKGLLWAMYFGGAIHILLGCLWSAKAMLSQPKQSLGWSESSGTPEGFDDFSHALYKCNASD